MSGTPDSLAKSYSCIVRCKKKNIYIYQRREGKRSYLRLINKTECNRLYYMYYTACLWYKCVLINLLTYFRSTRLRISAKGGDPAGKVGKGQRRTWEGLEGRKAPGRFITTSVFSSRSFTAAFWAIFLMTQNQHIDTLCTYSIIVGFFTSCLFPAYAFLYMHVLPMCLWIEIDIYIYNCTCIIWFYNWKLHILCGAPSYKASAKRERDGRRWKERGKAG